MANTIEVSSKILDEWLKLEAIKSVVTSPAGTYHDTATGKFTAKPGGGGGRKERDHDEPHPGYEPKLKKGVRVGKLQLGQRVKYNDALHGWGHGKITEITNRVGPDGHGYVRVDDELVHSSNILPGGYTI